MPNFAAFMRYPMMSALHSPSMRTTAHDMRKWQCPHQPQECYCVRPFSLGGFPSVITSHRALHNLSLSVVRFPQTFDHPFENRTLFYRFHGSTGNNGANNTGTGSHKGAAGSSQWCDAHRSRLISTVRIPEAASGCYSCFISRIPVRNSRWASSAWYCPRRFCQFVTRQYRGI